MSAASRTTPGLLGLDGDELVACVACGLCLPHCPTYRVTGLEIASPRGRIAAMRFVEERDAPIDDEFVGAMEACVQCRGCEAACPSGVAFGHLMEDTRAALEARRAPQRTRWRRISEHIGYRLVLPRHWLVLAGTWLLLAAQRLRLVPARLGLPALRARSLMRKLDVPVGATAADTVGSAPTAWLFTGCVMDAWFRDVHRASARVMRATGARLARPAPGGDCCGALHVHAGRHDEAVRLAQRVMASMPGDAAIVVNSAGCGAAMKDYGRLVGTAEARAFAARVSDFSEWVAAQPALDVRATGTTLVVQDPCHLRHVQRAHGAVRAVLASVYTLVDTDDDGLCCGAGGAYAALQPELAREIRDRKRAAVVRAGGDEAQVVSANPGCTMHLRAAGLSVRHPAELLDDVLTTPTRTPEPEDA